MPGIDPASLTQEVSYGRGAAVVNDRPRFIHQPIPELGDQGLDGKLVNGCVEWNTGHHVAEGNHLPQFRSIAGDSVVQLPLKVHGMSQESPVAVDGYGVSSHHSHG